MGLRDDIKESIDSINEDVEIETWRNKKQPEKYAGFGNRGTPEGDAWFKMMIPHLIGFGIGLAVARLFSCKFVGYIIFGLIFAYLTGVYKSHTSDRISWKYAFIKNALLSLRWILIAVLALILGFVMNKYDIK